MPFQWQLIRSILQKQVDFLVIIDLVLHFPTHDDKVAKQMEYCKAVFVNAIRVFADLQ